jgi:hypothetical protein
MHVADMEDSKSIEPGGKLLERNIIVPNRHPFGIILAAPIQARQLQGASDDGVNRIPILDMKEVEALTEHLGLVVGFNSQALSCVQPSQPLLQPAQDGFAHHDSNPQCLPRINL